ncbi:MAG: apolipoprotein N-acyltransferase [Deltaproteobacteria bacterium]|nr:apolipoprotein N-acyltransferase [Deltaproteobacteria bacterium]
MSRARFLSGRSGWLLAYAVATFLSFPHPIGERVLDLGFVVGWLGPVFLALAVAGLPSGRALRLGFLAGWLAHTAILHWIYHVTVIYGHAPVFVGFLAPAGLALYLALFPALFAAAFASLRLPRAVLPFAGAALWAVSDHLRSFLFSGFPWGTLGYAQHLNEPLLPVVAFTGVYGLSFLTVLGGLGALEAVRARGRAATWAAPALVLLAHGLGALTQGVGVLAPAPTDSTGPTIRIAAIQGNIDQGVKWSPEWADRTLQIYERLSRAAAREGAELILWPETAVPGSVNRNEETRARLGALAVETGATLVVGAVAVEEKPEGELRPGGSRFRFFDSAFVLEGEAVTERYDKAHLVPFGEYVPLRNLVGRFFQAVAAGIADDNVTRGSGPRAVTIGLPGRDGVTVGVPICYELIFPDLVRRFVHDGAGVLLAITNDAWYGQTGAPHQFLAMTAVRSAENRVWTARAANTGVTAIIDAQGRVREQTAIFEEGFLVADVPLLNPPAGGTYYSEHGDRFVHACWLAGLAALVVSRRRVRREEGETR